jgi:hypothetical protein
MWLIIIRKYAYLKKNPKSLCPEKDYDTQEGDEGIAKGMKKVIQYCHLCVCYLVMQNKKLHPCFHRTCHMSCLHSQTLYTEIIDCVTFSVPFIILVNMKDET